MSLIESVTRSRPNRRMLLKTGLAAMSGAALGQAATAAPAEPVERGKPTQFQIACMTLPYRQLPLQTALRGIKSAGYEYVAWGTAHVESPADDRTPVMPTDAPASKAKELGKRCRDMGLEPVMMFSTVYPEASDAMAILTNRVKQAAAADIGQVLTFGHTEGGNAELWIKRFRQLAPIARDLGVMIVIKQHGGSTGTGEACANIARTIDDPAVMVNFDAGNVMDYLDLDPIPDIQKCADMVRSFCIKDHRNWPEDRDCGPGFGEIDHYRLLAPVAFTGLKMPLCCENIFAPLLPRPDTAEGINALAQRARVFLETVIAGLQA